MLPIVTTLTAPRHTALTTLEAVKTELMDVTVRFDEHDALLARYVLQASATIVRITRRQWARARYREFRPQQDGGTLWLRQTPLLVVEALDWADRVNETTEALTEYDLLGTEGLRLWGTAWHRCASSAHVGYQVDYAAGYLLPDDDYTAMTLSFVAADNTILDSANGLPLLVAGDTVAVSGAVEPENTGTATVVSRTDGVLEVSGLTLTDEAAGAEVTLTVRTLPEDVEWACIELVKSVYLARQQRMVRPPILEEPGGSQRADEAIGDIPRIVWRLLKPYHEVYV